MRELKIGIYGGTFDPPHIGHIAAAKAAMETLALDRLLLIPTFIPPHKALPAGAASPAQRRDMAVLATAELGKKPRCWTWSCGAKDPAIRGKHCA